MSATVVDLTTHRRNKRDLPGVKDSVAQVIMENFRQHKVFAIAEGIGVANRVIDGGGSFLDAIDAAEKAILIADEKVALDWATLKNEMTIVRRERLEPILRERMAGRPDDQVTAALECAHRVLDGGGTMGAAMWRALGDDVNGPEEI
jgi:hypothetical protein